MDDVIANIEFHHYPEDARMAEVGEQLAVALDYHHECSGSCPHTPTLHIRLNDTKTGKGMDFWFREKGE